MFFQPCLLEKPCNNKYCLYHGGTVNGPDSLKKARTLCSQNNSNGWLLEVYDEEVSQLVDEFINPSVVSYDILMNAEFSINQWKWINNQTFDQTDEFNDNQQIFAYLPFNKTTKRFGELNFDTQYSKIGSALCQKIDCTEGSCYFTVEGNFTWYRALNECSKQNSSLALQSIVNGMKDENFFEQMSSTKYWVGLSKVQIAWAKRGSYLNFTKWKNDYPIDDLSLRTCLILNAHDGNTWLNVNCGITFDVVCMKKSNKEGSTDSQKLSNGKMVNKMINETYSVCLLVCLNLLIYFFHIGS